MKSTIAPQKAALLEREFAARLVLACQFELSHGLLDVMSSSDPNMLIGVIELDDSTALDLFRFHEIGKSLSEWKEATSSAVLAAASNTPRSALLRIEACLISPVPYWQMNRPIIDLLRGRGVHVVSSAGQGQAQMPEMIVDDLISSVPAEESIRV